MKRILIVCPTMYEWEEIHKKNCAGKIKLYTKIFNENALTKLLYGCDFSEVGGIPSPDKFIADTIAFCKINHINAIMSASDYPGCVFASIVADALQLPGPQPQIVLSCQNKYQARIAQNKYVPEVTPNFKRIDTSSCNVHDLESFLPFYIKPIKARISILAQRIATRNQLTQVGSMKIAPIYADYFNWFLKNYSNFESDGHCFIAEQALSGLQVTVEGYVFEGEVSILGIIDSIMYPETQSFEYFIYPSRLPPAVLEKMAFVSAKFISSIGYDNGFFNIEFMYNPETQDLRIIEVNSRICSQFFDLYEKVDGFSSYDILIDVVTGTRPQFTRNNGPYACAGILVLRTFANGQVKKIPSKHESDLFYQQFPHGKLHVFVTVGQQLSDNPQDAESYRYGLIHLGGKDYQDLQDKFARARDLLPFSFKSV